MLLDASYCRLTAKGRLLVHLPYRGTGDVEHFKILSWEEGPAVYRLDGEAWVRDDHAFDYVIVSDEVDDLPRDHPVRAFRDTIPFPAAELVRPFGMRQIGLLALLRHAPFAWELARSSPLLFWIAPECLPHDASPEQIVELIGCKRTEILRRYAGRGTQSMLNFLGKLTNLSFDHLDAQVLKDLLVHFDKYFALSQLPRIDWQVFKATRLIRPLMGPKAIRPVLSGKEKPPGYSHLSRIGRILEDSKRRGETVDFDALAILTQARTAQQIQSIRDRWAREVAVAKTCKVVLKKGNHLPPPPLPGNDDIIPIPDVEELLVEGEQMHHCVGGYIDSIRSGCCFIYRVLRPERATLEVEIQADGKLRLGQCTLAGNGQPSAATFRAVRNWFDAARADRLRPALSEFPGG